MNTPSGNIRTVAIADFDRIALHVLNIENELVVQRGQRQSLTIEAEPELFDKLEAEVRDGRLDIHTAGGWADKIKSALSTSLTRPHVKYIVTTPRLSGLDIDCLAEVYADQIETDRLSVHFRGLGSLSISGLQATRLDIDVAAPSPCRIEVSGQVSEQYVHLQALSDYNAPALASDRTTIQLKGPGGHAVVRAATMLDVSIGGPGQVEYFGHPQVRTKISPLGSLKHLDEARN